MAASERAVELARATAEAAHDKVAQSVLAIDVSGQLALTDAFVIVSADNERQVAAVVDGIEEKLLTLGAKPLRREGRSGDRWILLDFGDIVVHVQHEEEREFYALERLWRDCPVIPLPDAAPTTDAQPADTAPATDAAPADPA